MMMGNNQGISSVKRVGGWCKPNGTPFENSSRNRADETQEFATDDPVIGQALSEAVRAESSAELGWYRAESHVFKRPYVAF